VPFKKDLINEFNLVSNSRFLNSGALNHHKGAERAFKILIGENEQAYKVGQSPEVEMYDMANVGQRMQGKFLDSFDSL
jgi:hypothetical protein